MTRLCLIACVVAGCTFRTGIALTFPDAGGDGSDLSATVDDLGPGADLARPVPDGVTPGSLGWPCADPSQCGSGYCVDGYCCDGACGGDPGSACHACDVPGSEGHCVPALAGSDPHQDCAADPASSCGHDGQCDGAGGCRLWPAGTACGSAACANDRLTFAPVCNGAGACVASGGVDCAPYVCADASSCASSCTPPANGCQPPAVCDGNGSCGKRPDGAMCMGGGDCQSGFCAQGVCCDQACSGSCVACNRPGTVGKCTPLLPGTQCGAAGCNGDSAVAPSRCDGAGTCQPGTSTSCVPYTCNKATAMCYGRPCSSSAQCAAGHNCNSASGKCM